MITSATLTVSMPMNSAYLETYTSEIFERSCCIAKENNLCEFFTHNLMALGYSAKDDSMKKWVRGNQQVVVCLVDDISSCADYQDKNFGMMFDRNTLVITDNFVNGPTQYQVRRLPNSFFGIYAYQPLLYHWRPERRFSMAIRRIDPDRLRVFLETFKSSQDFPDSDHADWLSFDCWDRTKPTDSPQVRQDNFVELFSGLPEEEQDRYKDIVDAHIDLMPFRNYDETIEEIVYKSWLNMVVETYSGDEVIALSEKTFRSLVTPVPFMLYAGRNSLCHLANLGFDILADLVPPDYDNLRRTNRSDQSDKHTEFVWRASLVSNDLASKASDEIPVVQARCVQASQHNQSLLRELQSRWPMDFANWWKDVVQELV